MQRAAVALQKVSTMTATAAATCRGEVERCIVKCPKSYGQHDEKTDEDEEKAPTPNHRRNGAAKIKRRNCVRTMTIECNENAPKTQTGRVIAVQSIGTAAT